MVHEKEEKTQENPAQEHSNNKTLVILGLITILMFGFGFALVPLYTVICKVAGLNGKTSTTPDTAVNGPIDYNRVVIVEFVTTNNDNLPWRFYPLTKKINIHPGENKRVDFYAENNSQATMTVQAIPSITPGEAARYLKKTECFCFTQQTLKSGQGLGMPVIFHIDRNLPKNIKEITLSYTLFDAGNFKPLPTEQRGKIR